MWQVKWRRTHSNAGGSHDKPSLEASTWRKDESPTAGGRVHEELTARDLARGAAGRIVAKGSRMTLQAGHVDVREVSPLTVLGEPRERLDRGVERERVPRAGRHGARATQVQPPLSQQVRVALAGDVEDLIVDDEYREHLAVLGEAGQNIHDPLLVVRPAPRHDVVGSRRTFGGRHMKTPRRVQEPPPPIAHKSEAPLGGPINPELHIACSA